MHNSLNRLQNVFGFFTTVSFVVCSLIALISFVQPRNPTADFHIRNIQVVRGQPHYWSKTKYEYAHIRFDLSADLAPIFDWNTKQAFLYLYATYSPRNTTSPPLATYPDGTRVHGSDTPDPSTPQTPFRRPREISEAVIWDSIVCAPTSPYAFSLADAREFLSPRYLPYIERYGINPKPRYRRSERQKLRERSRCPPNREVKTSFDKQLSLNNVAAKYKFQDFEGTFDGMGDVRLRLGWNVQPWVGALKWGVLEGGEKNIEVKWPRLPEKGEKKQTTIGEKRKATPEAPL